MLDARDLSILTQVAFKEAARFYDGTDESVAHFTDALSILSDSLVVEVKRQFEANLPARAPQQQAPFDAEAALASELGATPIHGAEVSVIGEQHGPLPEWLIAQAAAKGVTKVFDNRADIQSGKAKATYPWFKSPKDQGSVAFWPPKKK